MENPWSLGALCSQATSRISVKLAGRSHSSIAPNANASTATVWWGRGHVETFHSDTRPEAARLKRRFSSDGMVALIKGEEL